MPAYTGINHMAMVTGDMDRIKEGRWQMSVC